MKYIAITFLMLVMATGLQYYPPRNTHCKNLVVKPLRWLDRKATQQERSCRKTSKLKIICIFLTPFDPPVRTKQYQQLL